jgi:DNA-binding NtrC family response regulator
VVMSARPGSGLHYGSLATSISGGHRHRSAVERGHELAVSPLPLVLEGATGTGKELMARAVHEWSQRTGAFLAVNCAIYSRTMAAAELFGFKKGAFTGAEQSSLGHVRAAHGGTLFLDEVLELSLDVQAMLLRTLELREVLPLGETRAVPVDVRFVVATQLPLADAVAAGRFRADLRARLEGAIVRLPPLAECREIVPELLVELYGRRRAAAPLELSATAAEALCMHGWPLNVRELDMLAGRLAARSVPGRVEVSDLELEAESPANDGTKTGERPAASNVPGRRPSSAPYDDVELERLRAALARHAGNVSRAVAELGITRQRAYRMLELMKPSG